MREWIVLRKGYQFGMPSIKAKSAADRRPQRGMSYHLAEAGPRGVFLWTRAVNNTDQFYVMAGPTKR